MIWSSEADAKLFVGVLNQLRGKLKLDYQELAMHMGGDCTSCAVEQRMVRLRRMATAASMASSSATGGGSSTNTTPNTTPRKRKGDSLATAPAKKTKTGGVASGRSEKKGPDTALVKGNGKAEMKVESEIKDDPVE
ncbi:hypothetical protein AnigIFM62618_009964 [Aspergillus niger]|nr:hypothetical protein AnigIFM62618_009964 [Aspergillus niger]